MGEIYYVSEMVDNHIEIAKSFFETATNYAPDYYKPYANLGHIYYYENLQFNDPDLDRPLRKALQNYAIARKLLPPGEKDYLLQYNLGWLYYHYNNYDGAFREWSDLYVDRPSDPVLSYAMGCVYYHLNQPNLAEMEFAKSIAYSQELADHVAYINPTLDRHIEIYTQLARSYNNRGVIYARTAQADPRRRAQFENGALLDFQRSKNEMNKINQIYEYAEVNIKYILNREIRGRQPAFDDTVPKRTTLTKWIEEFRQNLIGRI
jgi:tetratricopeptide (TPR) repeat protein